MENNDIDLRPAPVFAFIIVFPFMLLSVAFLILTWKVSEMFIFFSLGITSLALYRYTYIRKIDYLITAEFIRIRQGIFFKRTDQVEMYRVKGAHVAAA